MKQSAKFKLNKEDILRWVMNMRRFLAPLGLLYLTSVIGLVQADGHVFGMVDLVPSDMVRGGMTLYLLNSLFDLFSKWENEK